MNLTIEQDRLTRELDELGEISSHPSPSVTRVVYTEDDLRGRKFVKDLCAEAGLGIREDAIGNTFIRWTGTHPSLPAVATGSHIDALPHAGRFDGTVGVLGGLEAIRALQRAGYQPKRSIELILFTSEEPTRFGIGCLGSRFMTDRIASIPENFDSIRNGAGFHGDLETVRIAQGVYSAFVELHIEQGAILEREQIDLGVVTAIAAPAALRVNVQGEGGHAGAVLMPQRRDAFLAAAEIALAVEAAAKSTGAVDSVGTTGICDIFPRAVNSIPSRAYMEIDVRDIDGGRRDSTLAQIRHEAELIAQRRRVDLSMELINSDPPAQCDPFLIAALERACDAHSATHKRMISRAYHDSLFMSLIAPTAMLFIPCRNGFSHRPDEYASPHALSQGALVLAETLSSLSQTD